MADSYITTAGDMWDYIAYKTMGSERHKHLLVEANPMHVATVVFSAGIVLKIPEVSVSVSSSLPPWKR